jgi:ADP-ribose pyrophosphatase YjhB (NUDIX family)
MVRRICSFGFNDFINSFYDCNNLIQVTNLIKEMTVYEKQIILTYIQLYTNMINTNQPPDIFEIEINKLLEKIDVNFNEIHLFDKLFHKMYKNNNFISITQGINIFGIKYNLKDIILNSENKFIEAEWEFPKGRINKNETEINCALREFEEETGILRNNIHLLGNINPYEEIFIGSDFKTYKQKYYVCITDKNLNDMSQIQKNEISKMEWKTYDDCLKSIRPYNLEKKNIINKINKVMNEYRLYV